MTVSETTKTISVDWRRSLLRGTIGVIVVVVFAAVAWWRSQLAWGDVAELLVGSSPGFVVLALVAYYGSFPLRGLRWRVLLEQHGDSSTIPSTLTLTRFCLYGWLVNCALPAKLGELYRSYLAQRRSELPVATVFGTVLIERSADLVVLALLLPLAAWVVGVATNAQLLPLQLVAAGMGIALAAILTSFRHSDRLVRVLPPVLRAPLIRFAAGLQLRGRAFVGVTALTVPLWFLEGMRVYAEARALGLALSVAMSFLIALLAALLTTVPLTPAGIGAVEIGIAGTLILFGVRAEQAVALALLDRLVAYWSVFIVAGLPWIVERLRGS
ncbi:lysylphosphatidylglycerol synthase transmembrane domain-containing protein [Thermomicrobium sp. 4228-Ro]|uniref:lysylphosphatidylglycerol synthase transmembrane domain-containing protein n=1 Tax=Thermomicrobium sp. 4228-Ro TaxID=2993937 RepID=UPI0022497D25|nr:lysylphosphatidylglycerol synthase transmembrane domain-containing protein [Thermomicrobium sp. 4228-Ro]MCX2726076.1 lysylphosphatidylglycerol synthase transmembrane domain-containing protein [Thermomicrobium sp. 4228-Ro]